MRLSSAVAPVQRAFARRSALVATLAIGTSILLSGAGATAAPTPTALQLNGSAQYVTMGAAPGLGAAQFTLETWFKRTGAGVGTSTGAGGITSVLPLVTKGRAEAEGSNVDMNYFLGIDTATNKLAVDFEEGASGASPGLNHPLIGNTVVTSNVWHHARTQTQIQATKDLEVSSGNGLLGRWGLNEGGGTTAATSIGSVNGTLANAGWVAGAPVSTDTTPPAQPQGLLALPGDGSVSLSWTPNSDADLAGYNVYRSTTSPVPTTGTPINGSALLTSPSYVDVGVSNGTTYHYVVVAVDNAGNPSVASAEAVATPVPSGPHALEFNGSSQYVTMGAAPSLNAAQFTLETWFKRTGAGVGTSTGSGGIASALPLVTKGRAEAEGSNVDMNYFLGIDASSGRLVADFEEGPGGSGPLGLNHPISGQTAVTSNVWHHAAASYDGTSWKLYLDGVLDAKLAVGQPPRSDSIQHAALATALNSSGVAAGFFQGD